MSWSEVELSTKCTQEASCRDRAFFLWATRADAEQVMKSIVSCGADCLDSASQYVVDLGKSN